MASVPGQTKKKKKKRVESTPSAKDSAPTEPFKTVPKIRTGNKSPELVADETRRFERRSATDELGSKANQLEKRKLINIEEGTLPTASGKRGELLDAKSEEIRQENRLTNERITRENQAIDDQRTLAIETANQETLARGRAARGEELTGLAAASGRGDAGLKKGLPGTDGILTVGEAFKDIPGAGALFSLAGKAATATTGRLLTAIGLQSEESRQAQAQWWSDGNTFGQVVEAGIFLATVGTLSHFFAPAKVVGGRAAAAGITRFQPLTTAGRGPLLGNPGKALAAIGGRAKLINAAKAAAGLTRTQSIGLVKGGIALMRAHPFITLSAFGAHQTATFASSWLAADNLGTMASVNVGGVADDVKFGNLTASEAEDILDRAERDIKLSSNLLRLSAFSNPVLYGMWFGAETQAKGTKRKIETERLKIANQI